MPGLGGLPTAKLAWYARRLRSMDPREVADRARTAGATAVRRVAGDAEPDDAVLLGSSTPPDWHALLADFRAGVGRPVLLDRATAAAVAADHPEAAKQLIAAADRVLEHRFTFFAHPETHLGGPDGAIDWWHDPLAGFRWPDRPSHAINHRTLGDPKWIWELNRLQHLPWLAQAWLITGDARYGSEALDQLDSWIAANPPGHGIAWRGAFEVGVRALSVTVALQGLADHPDLDAGRFRRAVRMLAAGARRCWRDRSRHSSANNHLVGELAGLAAVALAVPELAAAPRWESDALSALAAEADRQILGDGVGAEQAVGYQVFTAELVAVVALLRRLRDEGRAGGGGVSSLPGSSSALRLPSDPRDARLLAALERSAAHLADLVGTGDPTPRTGDDDEGFALRLDPAPTREVRPHLALVAAMTGLPAADAAGEPDLTSAWVARRLGATRPTGTWTPGSAYAPDGGLAILRSGPRRVTVDVGPLGYLSIAAHGHADALAVGIAVDGHDVVGDPGTGSYFAHPDWRTAHRSTRAHATVAVDDADQSVMAGPFLWTGHAHVTVHEVDLATGRVDAEHDGYRRLEGPLVHRRLVEAPPDDEAVLVLDVLLPADGAARGATPDGGGAHTAHTARTTWPLHPDVTVDAADGPGVLARRDGRPVLRVLSATARGVPTPWRLRGGEGAAGVAVGPVGVVGELGWWSERLESRRACWLVGDEVAVAADAPTALATVLVAGEAAAAVTTPPEVVVTGPEVRVRWAGARGPRESTLIVPTA